MQDKGIGSELQRLMSTDDTKSPAIEAAKMLSVRDKDLAMKTEISDPISYAVMGAASSYLKDKKCPKSAKLLKDILENCMVYMVSKDRMGRKEIIDIVKSMETPQEQGFFDNPFFKRQGQQGV